MSNYSSFGALVVSYCLLPFFLYEINKTSKKGWQRVRLMVIRNYLCGYSCADIESILWEYGIATHFVDITEGKEGQEKDKRFLESSFYVPSNQHFYADVLLRQNESKFGFIVMTPVVYQGSVPSTRYRNQQYKSLGIGTKQKSLVNRIALLLFGHMLTKKKFPVKVEQRSAKSRQRKDITK